MSGAVFSICKNTQAINFDPVKQLLKCFSSWFRVDLFASKESSHAH